MPTSHGIAIALLVYCRMADAARVFRRFMGSIPSDGSESSGERSNIELWDGLDDHWYGGGAAGTVLVFDAGAGADGTNDQAEVGSL